MDPSDLGKELDQLRIGRVALDWSAQKADQLLALRRVRSDTAKPLPWATLEQAFFSRQAVQA